MASVNKVIILGHLGQDPDVKQNSNGDPIANISVATSEQWKNKQTGEKESKSEWHRVVLFGHSAKFCASYAKKGSQVYLEGKLTTRKWTDKQGVDKWTTEIIVDSFSGDFKILSSDKKEDDGFDKALKAVDKNNAYQIETTPDLDAIEDDIIPF
jgi:single-strand DNA-binding protein